DERGAAGADRGPLPPLHQGGHRRRAPRRGARRRDRVRAKGDLRRRPPVGRGHRSRLQAGQGGDDVTSGEEPRRRIVVKKRRAFAASNRMGVWKLAYADLVTAMMAFFMVMWLLTQADLKLRSQIAMYFRSPGVLPGGAAINEELNAAR